MGTVKRDEEYYNIKNGPLSDDPAKIQNIMTDCRINIDNWIWFPYINDCHNRANSCMNDKGIVPPNMPRLHAPSP